MALTAQVTRGTGDPIASGTALTTALVNQVALPTVTITGTAAGVEADSITPAMLALESAAWPDSIVDLLKTDGAAPIDTLYTRSAPFIDVRAFGAIGDGILHTVQDWIDDGTYADLAAVQADFPWCLALTDSIDWVAIQAALDHAWQFVRTLHSNEDMSVGNCPVVYLGHGFYKTNRPLIVPPRCSFLGANWHATRLYYIPDSGAIPDTRWTNISSGETWEPPAQGLFSGIVIRYRVDTARTHITDSFSRSGDPMDPVFNESSNPDAETAYGTHLGRFSIITYADHCVGLLAHSLNLNIIEDVHFNGYGSTGVNNWGLLVSMDSKGAFATGVVVRNCYFENLVCAIHFDLAQQVVVTGHIVDQVRGFCYGYQWFDSQIYGNNACNRQSNYTGGRYAIDFTGNNVAISGNTFGGFDRAIDVAGANFTISGNAIHVSAHQPTPATGYAITIRNLTDKLSGTVSTLYQLAAYDLGHTVVGNGIAFEGSAPNLATVKPFLIDGSSGVLQVNAAANGYTAGFGSYADQYSVLGSGSLRSYDRQFCVQTGPPNQRPDHIGQVWSDSANGQLYVAVAVPAAVASGAIAEGVSYLVSINGVAVTYDSVEYAPGSEFVGVSAVTTFTGAGPVYPGIAAMWRALGAPRGDAVLTLATQTGASCTLTAAQVQANNVLRIAFNDSANDATVNLPDPALCVGARATLLVSKAAVASAKIVLARATALVDADTTTGTPVATIDLTASNSTAKYARADVLCDGSYWYVEH